MAALYNAKTKSTKVEDEPIYEIIEPNREEAEVHLHSTQEKPTKKSKWIKPCFLCLLLASLAWLSFLTFVQVKYFHEMRGEKAEALMSLNETTSLKHEAILIAIGQNGLKGRLDLQEEKQKNQTEIMSRIETSLQKVSDGLKVQSDHQHELRELFNHFEEKHEVEVERQSNESSLLHSRLKAMLQTIKTQNVTLNMATLPTGSGSCYGKGIAILRSPSDSRIFKSSNHPNTYPNEDNCLLCVYAPSATGIKITINTFETEPSFDGILVYSKILSFKQRPNFALKKGTIGSEGLLDVYHGTLDSLPQSKLYDGHQIMTLWWSTDGSTVEKGFSLYVSAEF